MQEISMDYQKYCENYIEKEFGFLLKNLTNIDIDIDLIYDNNKNKLSNDFEIIENNEKMKSRLYFENLMNEVDQHITDQKEKEEANKNQSNPLEKNPITSIELANLTGAPPKQTGNSSRNFTQSDSQQNRQKSEKGDKVEKRVNTFLIGEYGKENVTWVSNNKKSADHDFIYKDKKEKWWYVEVKTLSNNVFYISKNEKFFAEKNKENYQIFLVGDGEKIQKIFPVDFEKLTVEAEEFSVKYELLN